MIRLTFTGCHASVINLSYRPCQITPISCPPFRAGPFRAGPFRARPITCPPVPSYLHPLLRKHSQVFNSIFYFNDIFFLAIFQIDFFFVIFQQNQLKAKLVDVWDLMVLHNISVHCATRKVMARLWCLVKNRCISFTIYLANVQFMLSLLDVLEHCCQGVATYKK